MSIISTVGAALCAFALVMSLVSTVLPYWTYQNQGKQSIHAGLWRNCTVYDGTSDCKKPSEGWVHAVQALMILGLIVSFLSMVFGFLRLKDESRGKVSIVATLAAVLAGFLVTAAAIIFGEKNKHNSCHYSAGFYLAIITAVTSFIAAALFAISRRRSGYNAIG